MESTSPTLEAWVRQKTLALTANVPDASIRAAVRRAVAAYSRWYPFRCSLLVISTGASIQPLPASLMRSMRFFGPAASCFMELEHPYDEDIPNVWNPDEWVLTPRFSTKPHSITFLSGAPAAGEVMRYLVQLAHLEQVTYPENVAVALVGAGTGTLRKYKVTSLDDYGESSPSAEVSVDGPAVIDTTNYPNVTWTADIDKEVGGYRIYQTSPAIGLVGTAAVGATSFHDHGGAVDASILPPIVNTCETTIPELHWGQVSSKGAWEANMMDATAHAKSVASGTQIAAEQLAIVESRRRIAEDYLKDWNSLAPEGGVPGTMEVAIQARDNPYGAMIFSSNDPGSMRRTR